MSSNDGQWRMQWRDGSTHVDVRGNGSVAFTDDLTDVQSLSDGGELTIRDSSRAVPYTIEIRSSGGRLTRTYYVAGVSRGWDDEARKALADILPRLVRRSGLGAEARVKSIAAKKGVAGVLEEVALLESDYVRRLYLVALVDNVTLDSSNAQAVLAQVSQRMSSDYDRRVVLQHVVGRVRLDQRSATTFVQVLDKMRSDYDRRVTLKTLFDSGSQFPDAEELYGVINAMRSSYDKRVVLSDLMARPSLSTEHKQMILRVARGIQSDYDRSQVLAAYVQKFGVEPQARDAFFKAAGAIQSAYERRRVLTEVARKGPANAEVQRSAFELIGLMSSDHDRAEALLALLGMQPMDSATRQAFVAAAERIQSSYDQNRVLAALVKSERR
jgi:uncharacterized protein YeeX (DUF496 family)